ncbi:hypothetical protein ACOSP7_020964 [Xanthoceras sorbifolium]
MSEHQPDRKPNLKLTSEQVRELRSKPFPMILQCLHQLNRKLNSKDKSRLEEDQKTDSRSPKVRKQRKGWTRLSAFKRCSIVPSRGATENKGGGWDIDPKVEYGEEREALSARPVLPANQVAQEALPLAPAPAEVAPDQEERAELREEVKTLIVQQLQEEEFRMEGVRLSVHFSEMREVYSSTAENIMSYDLEISKETNAESL